MFTRVVQGKRPRPLALLAIIGAVIAAGILAAVALALVADTHVGAECDIQVANKDGSLLCTTTAGAKVRYLGDSNTTFGSSGTGTFNPFVRLQGSPTEAGYNTNGTVQFETKTGSWTHAILLSDIPIRTEDGCVNCWELFVDINDSNNAPRITLNDLEIWFTSLPNLTGYTAPGGFAAGATEQYDFEGIIKINDVNQGSGRGDLRYMIPLTGITIPAGCNYGNPACDTYFVLYSKWGTTGGNFASDGGFEEWKVKVYPVLANPTITTTLSASSVNLGTAVHDSATLTGATSDAGGTVTYSVYAGANTCTGTDLLNSMVTVTNGVVPDSSDFTATSAGTYSFQAVYSGDAKNNPATSDCTTEQLVVNQNTPAPHSTPVVNIKDTLTVSGFTADVTGNVLVGLYSDACVTQVGTDTSFAASSFLGGASQETSFVAVTAGTYYFKISYAGDTNNAAFSSCVENVGVSITSVP